MLPNTPEKIAETQARLRFLSRGMIAIALLAWVVHFRPFDDLVDRAGAPLGADYPVFYLAGRTLLDGRPDELYSHEAQQRRLHELFPALDAGDWLPFRYPPFVAAAMMPLAALPYAISFALFTGLSLVALRVAWQTFANRLSWMQGDWRGTSWWLLLGWPIVGETLFGGQSSLFSLMWLALMFAAVESRRDATAGALAALAMFKPNVMALVVLGYVLRYPRLLRGAVPVGLLLLAVSWCVVGTAGPAEYLQLGGRLATRSWDFETDAHKVHGLASWLTAIVPGYERPLLLSLGIVAVAAVVVRWRRRGDDRDAALTATAMLVAWNTAANPYVPIYDLTLLAVAAYLVIEIIARSAAIDARRRDAWFAVLFAALYCGPHASQALCRATGVQLFPIVWAVLTLTLTWQFRQWQPGPNSLPSASRSPQPPPGSAHVPRPV